MTEDTEDATLDAAEIQASEPDIEEPCPRCGKLPALCVCEGIAAVNNRVFVLILQHPQEQDRDLGTARLALLHFRKGALKIGLSWPNLAKALGAPADPRRWGVLYLGPKTAEGAEAKGASPAKDEPVRLYDRQGNPVDAAAARLVLDDLEGIIVLDGSWSQAKTLWWRNSWLLKCWRIVLTPTTPSRYGRLRKEPRRDGLSTLEATALAMSRLEPKLDVAPCLLASFDALLRSYRAARTGARPPR